MGEMGFIWRLNSILSEKKWKKKKTLWASKKASRRRWLLHKPPTTSEWIDIVLRKWYIHWWMRSLLVEVTCWSKYTCDVMSSAVSLKGSVLIQTRQTLVSALHSVTVLGLCSVNVVAYTHKVNHIPDRHVHDTNVTNLKWEAGIMYAL